MHLCCDVDNIGQYALQNQLESGWKKHNRNNIQKPTFMNMYVKGIA